MSQNLFNKSLFELLAWNAGPEFWSNLIQIEASSLLGPPSGQHSGKVASGEGGPKFLKICSKIHFLSNSRCNAGPDLWLKLIQIDASSLLGPPSGQHYVESCSKSDFPKFLKICSKIHFWSNSRCNAGPGFWLKLIQIEASSLLGVSLAPVCGQNSIALASWGVLGCFLQLCSHTHTQVYAQAVLKVGAPADVSSVGGTPGVWCLNVIGRECWVWVVPCTGSWPGQPPPTKWGKEP